MQPRFAANRPHEAVILVTPEPGKTEREDEQLANMLAERKAKILDFALEKLEQAKDGPLPAKHKAGKDRDVR